MNVLEKILEEIKEATFQEDAPIYMGEILRKSGAPNEMEVDWYARESIIKAIIHSHMNEVDNDDWIPCSKRLPEEHDSAFAIYKDTHLWSESMFEKVSEPVNITYELEDGTRKTGISHTLDGKWKVEKENGIVKRKVVAWKPLPEPYRAADDSKPDWKENMLNTFLAGH